jgi:O-antigen ligase
MISRFALAAYLVLVFSLGFMQPSVSILGFRVPLADFIFLVTFSIWLVSIFFKKTAFRFGNFYFPLILYFLALVFSTIFSNDLQHSFIKLLGEIYLIGLAVLSFNLIRSIKDAKKTVFVWLCATFVACLVSVITFAIFYIDPGNPYFLFALSHQGTLPPGNYPRIQSTFLNPNMFCNYLNVSLMFVLAAYKLGWIKKTVSMIFFIFFFIAAFFTLSPGLGGILLCLGLWFWLLFREKENFLYSKLSLWLGCSAAFLFFIALLFAPNENPLSPYRFNFLGKVIYPSERLLAWQASLQTLTENPVFGRGIGLDVVSILSVLASGQKHFVGDSHQLWLNVAGQAGIVGLAAICYLSYFFYKKVYPLELKNNPNKILRICFGLAFVGSFLYQGLGGSFENARHLWILIGLLGSFGEEVS